MFGSSLPQIIGSRAHVSLTLLQTRKIPNQGFLVVKFKSSLRNFYGRQYDLVERYEIAASQITTDMSLSSFVTYHCL